MRELAALMLIGPGEADRHLGRCIRAARRWADVVIVYGDAPDPATEALIATFADVWRIGEENLFERSECLARNQLLALADERLDPGAIAIVIDADEELRGPEAQIRAALRRCELSDADSWNLHSLHLWNPEGTLHRTDGNWQPSFGTRIYRHEPGGRVEPVAPGSWVSHPIPTHLMRGALPVAQTLHWSYARESDRAPKHARYTRLLGHSPAHVESILDAAPTLEPLP